MNEINKQVSLVRRRLVTGQFFRVLTWSLFAGLLLAAIGMLVPKIWHLGFLQSADNFDAWNYSWILSGMVLALIVAAVLTMRQRVSRLSVATEIDKRFGLKERLSSAITLSENDVQSGAGQALLDDAVRRAETIDVRDQFRYQPTWKALLPVVPLAMMLGLLFIPNATEKTVVAKEPDAVNRKQVAMAIKEFKQEQEKKERLTAKGLEDANPNLKSLEKKFDQLLDEKTDKKDALVALNDIKKQIQDRRRELGDTKELKENLNKLKDVTSGPAKKIADAFSEGDMQAAQKAIKELADKLREGKLNEIEKKKLAHDLEAMANELKKIAEKHEQEKKELEDQIKKALDEGDLDKAAELQQQLEQKQQQDQQQEKMKKMAENLQKCAKCMKPGGNGDPKQGQQGDQQQNGQNSEQQAQAMKEAAESLEDIAQQLEQMQQEMQEMDALEDLEKLAGDCKGCMNGEQPGEDKPQWQDWAKGSGRGHGKRDLEKEDTGGFKARVKGKLVQGETVVTGNADGNNISGRTASEARELVHATMSKESDPLENQKLPKAQREHAQQYFEALREND